MATKTAPRFRNLSDTEIATVLRRNHVGRIAFTHRDRVDIRPIHYVFSGGWIFCRTSPGQALENMRHNRWVAFEVDEIEDWFQWRSVVVHGAVYPLTENASAEEARAWEHALSLLRRVMPETLEADDPVPFRNVLFRIAVQEATGREATT